MFLVGPRGCGKSTYLQCQVPEAFRIDLLVSDAVLRYSANPDRLEGDLKARGCSLVVIDEIQRCPQLLPTIHRLIEADKSLWFFLTGSSVRKLRHEATDLLGGRASLQHLGPFLAAELSKDWDFARALQIGTIPLIWCSPDPTNTLKEYLQVYLRQEILQEGIVRNLAAFSRFLEVASMTHAQLWTSAAIARESGVPRQTVDQYLEVLDELFLGFQISVFTRRAQRQLSAHRKFYFTDAGIFRCLRPVGPLDALAEIEGAAIEGLVATHLLQWTQRTEERHSLHLWRTRSGLEVDFIVYGPLSFVAIEVKRGATISPSDLKALKAFHEDYPEASLICLYGGKERLQYGPITCLPVSEYLPGIIPGQALPVS